MKLRPYQKHAVSELFRRFERNQRVVAVAPTGSGKTVIGAAFIRRLKGKRVLWLAHRVELLRQARDQLVAGGIPKRDVGLLSSAETTVSDDTRVLVASVGMFQKRKVPAVELIVVDEAHHVAAESYRAILDQAPEAWCLGLTATPWRLDGRPLGDAFEDLFVMAEAVELAAEGFIMESVVYGIPRDKAEAMVAGLRGRGGDYSTRKLDAIVRKRPLMADIVKEWHRLAEGRPTIVYACTVEHAKELCERFVSAGVSACAIDWSTPDGERAALLGERGKLARGAVKVVVNVGILTEGVDCPPVKCIVIARPTKSLTLHRQMCGRGSRPSGKARPLVLDHAGNTWRLGLPEAPVEWSLEGRRVGAGDAPVKLCENCGSFAPLAARECQECGTAFPITERELAEREAELERIRAADAEMNRRRRILQALAAARGLGDDWVERVLSEAA